MVVTDIQACFAAGALCADLAAPAILARCHPSSFRESSLYARLRRRVLFYPALFLGPSATLFVLAWPGWESQYIARAFDATAGQPWNAAWFALFLFLLAAGAWFGNWVGFRWILAGARLRLRVLYGTVLLATVALLLARWPAPIRLGSYQAFSTDPTALPYVWQDTTFFAWFWALTLYCAVPLVVLVWRARREIATVRDTNGGAERAA